MGEGGGGITLIRTMKKKEAKRMKIEKKLEETNFEQSS